MTENQKLRDAFELGWKMAANWSLSDHLLADMESPAYLTERDGLLQALATTEPEPEPTGMPELHPVAHIELGDDSHDVVTIEAAKAYGEQCWKAGYKHGAWGDKPDPTSKQPLQVEPAVNQQLTTEPIDEREAFEKWLGIKPCGAAHDFGWAAWQARAAMTQGVKG